MSTTLAAFNTAPRVEARALLSTVLDVSSWMDTLVDARPYRTGGDLLALADSTPWTDDETRAAVAGRPRLGGPIPSTNNFSPREQASALAGADGTTLAKLESCYESRFGMVFMIRAAGRSGTEVLAELRRRLENNVEAELVETAQELRAIAHLRLVGLLAGRPR